MRKLNRYGWLVLFFGVLFVVLMLAQGCKGDAPPRVPAPGLDATHVTTIPARPAPATS